MRAMGLGVKQQAANSFLEKKFKKRSDFNYDETVQVSFFAPFTAVRVDECLPILVIIIIIITPITISSSHF